MKMPDWLKQYMPPPRNIKAEARHLRHELKNNIQAIQGGNRILRSLSGAIDLNRRGPRP